MIIVIFVIDALSEEEPEVAAEEEDVVEFECK